MEIMTSKRDQSVQGIALIHIQLIDGYPSHRKPGLNYEVPEGLGKGWRKIYKPKTKMIT